jgi:glycosyltransferase involved in cell wall biosynthesis
VVERPRGTVIIPAHNESAVIGRTLRPLAELMRTGKLDVVVVCNGCADETADQARRFSGATVLETIIPSKANALNLGDENARAWPRVYLDADILVSPDAIIGLVETLDAGEVLAARLPATYDATRASWLVRSYYRARARVPSLHGAMWGAGNYGLSRSGHRRLGRFPDVRGDDLWVDRLFGPEEKAVVHHLPPVVVQVPRTLRALLAVTRRNVAGVHEDRPTPSTDSSTGRTLAELLATVRGPGSLVDAIVYSMVAVLARLKPRAGQRRWERDDTSRR